MAHNLMVTDNGHAYIGRQSAWHNLGTVTGHYLTAEEIFSVGGLDYTVFKSQLHDGRGELVNAWATFRWNKADRIARDASKAVFLGVVGQDYEVIQHGQGFSMMDALVASTDGAHYETAGALGNGEQVWGLADLGLTVSVGDDKQSSYLMFATGHDGSMSHQYRIVNTRVVCANTLAMALGEKTRSKLLVRHTKNAQSRISEAHEVLNSLQSEVHTVEEKLNLLAQRRITREAITDILDRLYPKSKGAETGKVDSVRRTNVLAEVLSLYESNDGNAFPEQRGTAYNLLNAITEHTDHLRTTRGNMRAESALFGTGEKLKQAAVEVLLEAAPGLPSVATARTYATVTVPVELPSIGGLLGDILAEHDAPATV